MARRIEVELVADATKLQRGFAQATTAAKKWDRQMKQTTAASRSATAALGAAAIGWQTAVAGGALLLGRQFVNAARDAEVILGQTRVALSDAGLSWTQYGKTIEDASSRISNASAFDDEQVLQSFQTFVRGQKDVQKSIQLTELAADVARGRYIDLEQATQLVNKAAMGQVGALRRAGIQIDKNATSAQALDALLKAYSGSAKTYADSATGSSEKLAVAWENLAEQAGGPLSLALANLADQLTIIVGLMQQAKGIKIPDGGFLGKVLKGAATGILPGFALPGILGGLGGGRGGGGGPTTPGTQTRPPTSRFFFGKKPEMGAGSFFDAIDNIVNFTSKWVDVGKKYADAQKAAEARADAQQKLFDTLQLNVDKTGLTRSLQDDLKALRTFQGVLQNIIATQGSTLELQRTLLGVELNISDVQDTIAANRQAAAEKARRKAKEAADRARDARKAAAEARQAATERKFGWLDFAVERAGATTGKGDDLRAYKALEQALLGRIRKEGRTLELVRDLWQTRQNMRDLNKREQEKETRDIASQRRGDQTRWRHMSSNRFIAGLGLTDLSSGDRARLRAGITQMGPGGVLPPGRTREFSAGRGGTQINIHNFHSSATNMRQLENDLVKRSKSRAHTRRGP